MALATKSLSALDLEYERACKTPSDIQAHLPVIYEFAQGADHVTEFGVRGVVSTWAILAARPKKLVSIDIEDCPVEQAREVANASGIAFEFLTTDTLNCEIEPTDLLLIDTWHTYAHVLSELLRHAPKVRKHILLHDTDTHWPKSGHPGMKEGVAQFIKLNPDWRIERELTGCHGLTALQRIGHAHDQDSHDSTRAELQKTIDNERVLCRDIPTWNNYLAAEKQKYRQAGRRSWLSRLFGRSVEQ